MNKIAIFSLVGTALLGACGKADIDVVKLDYLESHWNVDKYNTDGVPIDMKATKAVLNACVGKRTTELNGDLTVYDTLIAGKRSLDSSVGEYTMRVVTYVSGDQNYAVCRNNYTNRLEAKTIDKMPSFVDRKRAVETDRVPSIQLPTTEQRQNLLQADGLDHTDDTITPFKDSLLSISPAFYGKLEMAVDGKLTMSPISTFEPARVTMADTQLAIGYNKKTMRPYVLQSYDRQYYVGSPITFYELENPEEKQNAVFDELSVHQIAQVGSLEPDVPTPIYEFTYNKNGGKVTEIVTVTFRQGEFLKDGEEASSDYFGWEPERTGEPILYLHNQPFDGDAPLHYPDILRTTTNQAEYLLTAIEAAELVNRTGEQQEYRFLTLTDGMKGQEFEVTTKQRSKKMDVFLTDPIRDQTFKLTSEGAETFLSIFPELKERER